MKMRIFLWSAAVLSLTMAVRPAAANRRRQARPRLSWLTRNSRSGWPTRRYA